MNELTAAIVALTAVLTAIGGLFAAIKKLAPDLKGLNTLSRDWNGEPARPGVEARPGVMERLADIDAKLTTQGERLDTQAVTQAEHTEALAAIHHELHPNSGKSLRDSLDRVERNTSTPATIVITPPAADAA